VQKRGDGVLFVEAARGRERKHIDSDEVAVGSRLDESLDGCRRGCIGCLGPTCDIGIAAICWLFDHLVGAAKQWQWNGNTESLGSLEV
jgi:hypothetical protein